MKRVILVLIRWVSGILVFGVCAAFLVVWGWNYDWCFLGWCFVGLGFLVWIEVFGLT